MPGSTSPLAIPYPIAGDSLRDAVSTIPQQAAEKVDDLLSAVSGVSPTAWVILADQDFDGENAYQRRAGMVTLTVAADGTSWNSTLTIGTLPIGFRPSREINFSAFASATGAPVWVRITTAGRIYPILALNGGGTIIGSCTFSV